VVVRTSWVYGSRAPNFVRTMLRLATEREEIGVVNDQFGCPTSAADVAGGLSRFTRLLAEGHRPANDLYHLASPDSASWFDLAKATLDASAAGFSGTLRPLTTAEYPTRAARPADTRLDSGRIGAEFGIVLPSWRRSLPPIVADLEDA